MFSLWFAKSTSLIPSGIVPGWNSPISFARRGALIRHTEENAIWYISSIYCHLNLLSLCREGEVKTWKARDGMFKVVQDPSAVLFLGRFQQQPLQQSLLYHSHTCVAATYLPGAPCQPLGNPRRRHKVNPLYGFPNQVFGMKSTSCWDHLRLSHQSGVCLFSASFIKHVLRTCSVWDAVIGNISLMSDVY